MIRLPPTSISLSENDLQHHLHQIDVYHGLLAQGFKKKDILRYYAEHEAQTAQQDYPQLERAPTCVEMASHASLVNRLPFHLSSLNLPASPACPPSPSTLPDLTSRHAPRQSSLLRFTKAISPDTSAQNTSEDDTAALGPEFLSSPRSQVLKFRARTNTEPYNASEDDNTTHNNDEYTEVVAEMSCLTLSSSPNGPNARRTSSRFGTGEFFGPGIRNKSPISSPLRPEAEVFTPQHLPPPFSSRRRISTPEALPSARQEEASIGMAALATRQLAAMQSMDDLTSSFASRDVSAILATEDIEESIPRPQSEPSAVLPGGNPSTPTRRPQGERRTEPRPSRHTFDGTSAFAVYNDSLPAELQPRTPADLSRRDLLTERDAAYTAPPGALRTHTRNRLHQMPTVLEPGEQSPTIRAIGIRERRAREIRRGVRVEAMRADREGAEENARDRTEERDTDLVQHVRDRRRQGWRSGLDADRVGEENFGGGVETAEGFLGGRGI